MTPLVQTLNSPAKTIHLGEKIGAVLSGGEVIALFGELGAGKTHLVRGIAIGAGVPTDLITSPTFTLIQEYLGRVRIAHVDLFRLEKMEDLDGIGLREYFTHDRVVLVEWAEKGMDALPVNHFSIRLDHAGRFRRVVTMEPRGPLGATLYRHIIHAVEFP